jgi:hypothetical protein
MQHRTLHKIHTFIEAQQNDSKLKMFFRRGEMIALFTDCRAGLNYGLDFFQVRPPPWPCNNSFIEEYII